MSEDLAMRRGDSAIFDLTLLAPDESPLDLTDAVITFTAKYSADDPDSLAVFSVTNADDTILVTAPLTGEATIELAPSHTSSMPAGFRLYYDVQVRLSDDRTYTVASGRLNVTPDITRTNA